MSVIITRCDAMVATWTWNISGRSNHMTKVENVGRSMRRECGEVLSSEVSQRQVGARHFPPIIFRRLARRKSPNCPSTPAIVRLKEEWDGPRDVKLLVQSKEDCHMDWKPAAPSRVIWVEEAVWVSSERAALTTQYLRESFYKRIWWPLRDPCEKNFVSFIEPKNFLKKLWKNKEELKQDYMNRTWQFSKAWRKNFLIHFHARMNDTICS